jgi:hypothetical protein
MPKLFGVEATYSFTTTAGMYYVFHMQDNKKRTCFWLNRYLEWT